VDKRWKQLGDLLVNYSMKIKPGEKVMIVLTRRYNFYPKNLTAWC
jgi:hypothetical protein